MQREPLGAPACIAACLGSHHAVTADFDLLIKACFQRPCGLEAAADATGTGLDDPAALMVATEKSLPIGQGQMVGPRRRGSSTAYQKIFITTAGTSELSREDIGVADAPRS